MDTIADLQADDLTYKKTDQTITVGAKSFIINPRKAKLLKDTYSIENEEYIKTSKDITTGINAVDGKGNATDIGKGITPRDETIKNSISKNSKYQAEASFGDKFLDMISPIDNILDVFTHFGVDTSTFYDANGYVDYAKLLVGVKDILPSFPTSDLLSYYNSLSQADKDELKKNSNIAGSNSITEAILKNRGV